MKLLLVGMVTYVVPVGSSFNVLTMCISGVPFSVRVIDFGQLVVDYSEARSIPLGALAHILIDPRGYPDASVEAKCTG